jgi:Ca-activated chloride channel family protein
MLASSNDDPNGISRLDRAKYLLEKLIDKLSNDKIGLIVFAGEAYTQLPITSDFVSAKMFLNSINTEMVPTQGTAIGSAISMANNSFTPDETTQKAIIVITDGENHEDDAVEIAKSAAEQGVQIDVIGLGSGKGAPIPINAKKGLYLKDSTGKPVTTYLNENMAKEIAKAGNGIYISGNSSSAVSDIDAQLETLEKSDLERVVYSSSAEQFPVFAWIALIFLIIDIFILDSKNALLKKINFFSK